MPRLKIFSWSCLETKTIPRQDQDKTKTRLKFYGFSRSKPRLQSILSWFSWYSCFFHLFIWNLTTKGFCVYLLLEMKEPYISEYNEKILIVTMSIPFLGVLKVNMSWFQDKTKARFNFCYFSRPRQDLAEILVLSCLGKH